MAAATPGAPAVIEEGGGEEEGEEVGGQRTRVMSPSTTEEIQDAIRGGCNLVCF